MYHLACCLKRQPSVLPSLRTVQDGSNGFSDGRYFVTKSSTLWFQKKTCADDCAAQSGNTTYNKAISPGGGSTGCAVFNSADGKYYQGTESINYSLDKLVCSGYTGNGNKWPSMFTRSAGDYLCSCVANDSDQWTSTTTCATGLTLRPICNAVLLNLVRELTAYVPALKKQGMYGFGSWLGCLEKSRHSRTCGEMVFSLSLSR